MSQYDELKRLVDQGSLPPIVSALIAENERLGLELKDFQWGASVEAEAGDEARTEVSKLRAEIAGLRTGYQAYERVNAELKAENERLERNRDMWKGQVERQAEELVSFRSELRVMDVLAEAMAEVKATSDGESAQPIADIVSGCLAEIAALVKGEQS